MKYSKLYRGNLNDIQNDVESKIASYYRKNKDLKDVEWNFKCYAPFKVEPKLGYIEVTSVISGKSTNLREYFVNLDDWIDFLEEIEDWLEIDD